MRKVNLKWISNFSALKISNRNQKMWAQRRNDAAIYAGTNQLNVYWDMSVTYFVCIWIDRQYWMRGHNKLEQSWCLERQSICDRKTAHHFNLEALDEILFNGWRHMCYKFIL